MCGPGKYSCQPFCGPEGRFYCSDSVCSLWPAPFFYLCVSVMICRGGGGGGGGEEKPPTGRQAEDCANSAEIQPCPQTEAGLPLQKGWKTGTTIPKPARRQLIAQEAIPAEYPGTGIRGLPGSDQRLRRRIGQVRQARTMAPQPASQSATRWEQCAPLGRFPPGSGSLDAPLRPSRASWHA